MTGRGEHSGDIWLDNCSTTRTCSEAAEAALYAMQTEFGNPASLHFFGAQAYQSLGVARNQVAQVLGAPTDSILFTSGATEADNLAILGAMRAAGVKNGHFVTTLTEHSAVLKAADRLEVEGFRVTRLAPGAGGVVDAEAVAGAVGEDTVLVSIARVNNETGAIAPLEGILQAVKAKNPRTLVHTDDVQGFGKLPFKVWETPVDLLSLSGHKLHAPKGIGALYCREGVKLLPLQFGGSQERALRPGTESVPLICALGAAAHKSLKEARPALARVQSLRTRLLEGLAGMPGLALNSPPGASPYIVNISLSGCSTDAMVTALSMERIYVSGGAACSRGAKSHVLMAMGIEGERLDGALRIGLSGETTAAEIDTFLQALWGIVHSGEVSRSG